MSGASSPNPSPTNSGNSTPKPSLPTSSPVKVQAPILDNSIQAWIHNIHSVLNFPGMILTVISLLLIGAFAETAPRKSLELLDSLLGKALLFIIPFIIAFAFDWPTGLLAASISLIVFSRLQRLDPDSDSDSDLEEGFFDGANTQNTKIVSTTQRWFIEKVLGETPIAISSDRVVVKRYDDNDSRTSSSSSMSTNYSSDGTK